MTQRFTVELERHPVLRVSVNVEAKNITKAREIAIAYARDPDVQWEEIIPDVPFITKITAHANKPEAI